MENFLKVAQLLALLSASALCVYLIVVLMRLNGLLEMLQKDFSEMNKNLKPVLENLNVVTDKLRSITTKVDEQVHIFKEMLESFKEVAERVVAFEGRIERRLEEPIIRVTSLFGSIISKITSMFSRTTEQPS